ncbi:hypothetical protein B0A55_12873, partial [Friedmanniomyces simplex]
PAPPQQVISSKPSAPTSQPNTAPSTTNGTPAPTVNMPPTNGTPAEAPKLSQTPVQNKQPNVQPLPQQEPSKAIFIIGLLDLTTTDDVKAQIFTPEDVTKITRLDKVGATGRYVAHFADAQTMKEVLARGPPQEAKEKFEALRLSEYRPGPRGNFSERGRGGGFGSRGGPAQRGGAGPERGGYQSAGGATTGSDKEVVVSAAEAIGDAAEAAAVVTGEVRVWVRVLGMPDLLRHRLRPPAGAQQNGDGQAADSKPLDGQAPNGHANESAQEKKVGESTSA